MIFGQSIARDTAVAIAATISSVAASCVVQAQEIVQQDSPGIIRLVPRADTVFNLHVQSEQRSRNGNIVVFSLRYNLRFLSIDDRFAVEAVLTDVASDGPPVLANAFAASFSGVIGYPMRAFIKPDTGALSMIDVPDEDAQAVMAKLGAAELYSQIRDHKGADTGAPAMWMDDVGQVTRFANVDVDRLNTTAPDEATGNSVSAKPTLDGWTIAFAETGNAMTQTISEYEIARENGLVRRATTEVRRRDVAGNSGIMTRKTISLALAAK